MARNWTFGQKVGMGFAVTVILTVVIVAVGVYALRGVVSSKDRVIAVDAQILIDAERLNGWDERKTGGMRGFLMTGDERFLDRMKEARTNFSATLNRLKQNVYTDEGRRLLDAIDRTQVDYQQAVERIIAVRQSKTPADVANR
ncbi:MAG TPA: CHASE3 domain-containing protein, partial [Candidatus Binatia bacterium]